MESIICYEPDRKTRAMKDSDKTKTQLIQELAESRQQVNDLIASKSEHKDAEEELRQEQILRKAENTIRVAVASMDSPEDLVRVVKVIGGQLQQIHVSFDSISIQIVNVYGTDFVSVSDGSRDGVDEQILSANDVLYLVSGNAAAYPWVIEVWKSKKTRVVDSTTLGGGEVSVPEPVTNISLVDVPFSQGTLAINRQRQNAFDDREVALLQTFANILSEGFQRFMDITERKKVENALRKSQAVYRDLYDNSPDMLASVDAETAVIIDCNQTLAMEMGLEKDELVGKTAFELYTPESAAYALANVFPIFAQTGEAVSDELQLQRKDGSSLSVSLKVTSVCDDEGNIQYSRSSWRDISKRRHAEEALKEEIRIQKAFQRVTHAMLSSLEFDKVLDILGIEVIQAGIFRSLSISIPDYPRAVVRQKRSFIREGDKVQIESDFIEVERALDSNDILAETVRKGELQIVAGNDERFADGVHNDRAGHIAYFIPLKDGDKVVAVLATGSLTEKKEQTLTRINAIEPMLNQVTIAFRNANLFAENKLAEKKLKATEARYRNLFAEAPSMYVLTKWLETGPIVTDINEQFLSKLGYARDEVIGQSVEKFYTPESNAQLLSGGYQQAMEGSFTAQERQLLSRDGRIIETLLHALPELDMDKNVIGTRAMFVDITDRKRLEEEIRKNQNLESLGVLAGGIAHDFNNLLTGVIGNLSLLEMMLDKDSKEYQIAQEGKRASDRTRHLTQQLLTFAKGGAPIKESTSIEEMIKETTELSLHGSNAKAEFHFAEDLKSAHIDLGQIGQVVQNLVINADQSMPSGGIIKVLAQNVELSPLNPLPVEPGSYVKVSVVDQGIGMSADVMTKIFDPYFTTKHTGHGLGLSITHSIIQRHEGHLTVQSEIDKGTTFDFYLPAVREHPSVSTNKKAQLEHGSGRILLMDDEQMVHATIATILKTLGYEVESVYDGEAALKAYRARHDEGKPYDAVIMDLTIPGAMGGKEAIVELLKIDARARAIVSSGYANDPVMANYSEYGFVGKINKPADIEDLARTVKRGMAPTAASGT